MRINNEEEGVRIELAKKSKPYLGIISLQFGYAGLNILATVCLKHGMNHFILAFYRHVFATFAIAPFALFFDRKTRPKMTKRIFLKIMLLAFLEPVLDQNLYFLALKYTTSTFTTACFNVFPAITFIMSAIFRLEKVEIKKVASQAKIIGTIVTISGAMVMTLYRGPIVNIFGAHGTSMANHHANEASGNNTGDKGPQWALGALCILGCQLGWAGFFILQEEYPAQLSLTASICFMGAVEGGIVSLVAVRDMKAWALGWNSRLLASVYTGVVCSGMAYYVQGIVNREKGPVFITAFNPLCTVIVAALSFIFLHDLPHLGSVVGAVIIVVGLYTMVWGKSKDPSPTSAAASTNTEIGKKPQNLPITDDVVDFKSSNFISSPSSEVHTITTFN